MHAPLIFVLPPALRTTAAAYPTATVEAVSLYPTLVDLAKLPPLPRCPPPTQPNSDRVRLRASHSDLLRGVVLHQRLDGWTAIWLSGYYF